MEQQGSSGARAGLGQHLRRHRTQREAGVDDVVRQPVGGELTAFFYRAEAELLGVANAVGEVGERFAVVEIRRVHYVSGSAESIREREAPAGQALRVVKKQNFRHVARL